MVAFVVGLIVLCCALGYVLSKGAANPLEMDAQPIEPDKEMTGYTEDELIMHFKVSMFDQLYSLGYFREEDGTEQLEARDKKSRLVVAYMRDDLAIKLVKQPQQQGGNNGKGG